MPGEGGLDSDLCGFAVADFADHHHVRVLPQDRPQASGEGHVYLWIHRHLTDARQVIFDRVFDGEDVAGLVVEAAQGRIQAGGFAGARGTGHQENAMGFSQQQVQRCKRVIRHAQPMQIQSPGLFVEQAQHHSFAVR
ncbi:hypothetical protein D3C76_1090050 [compost metagenome]